jgi:CHAD domain-containing protein
VTSTGELSHSNSEVEWQLEAQDLRLVLRWLEDVPRGFTITPGPTLNHVDTYLDTEDRRLDRAGYSVRVRRSRRGPAEATFKSLAEMSPDALRVRLELSEEIDGDEPAATAVARAPGTVGRRVRALIGPRALVPLFDLQTRRRIFPIIAGEVPSGELLLDETAIREHGGRVVSRLHRVEVEAPAGVVATVAPLVESMQRALGLQPAALSKYQSALAATGNRRAEPESFGRTTIDRDDTIGEVGLAVLRRQFATLLAKESGTRLGDDSEELHAMRAASRRLRAAVALFRDALPAEAERLRPELAWVGRTIGVVRDLDVQLEQLDGWAVALPTADREPLDRLRALLAEERADARSHMLEALDSPRYARFVRRFGAMLRSRSGARTGPARGVAPDLVARRHRALRKAERRIGRNSVPGDYHRLRIAGKRFRYALEFLADLYPGGTNRLLKRTVVLQDVLGAYQDASVARARLRALAVERGASLGPETVFAMGSVAERYRREMEGIGGRVADAAAPLHGKIWKRLEARLAEERPPIVRMG